MSSLTLGVLAGLIAALGFGVGDYLAARISRQLSAIRAAFWTNLLELGLVGAVFLVFGWHWEFKPVIIGLALAYGVLFSAGLTSAWRAFRIGPVSLASAFVSGYALVVAIVALTLLHEHLVLKQAIAIVIMVGGAMVCSLRRRVKLAGSFWRQPVIAYALLGALGIGGSLIIVDLMVKQVGWQSTLLMQAISSVICMALLLKLRGNTFMPEDRLPVNSTVIICAVFLELGALMLAYGFSTSLAAVVAPVASISPLITVGLSLIFFKERLSRYQMAGISAIIGGLVLLAAR